VCGDAQDVQVAVADLEREQDVEPSQRYRPSTWKKSTASMLVARVRRSCRQLVSVCRTGAGGIRWRLRIGRIVEAPSRWPSLSNSPWIRTYPQFGLSVAAEQPVHRRAGKHHITRVGSPLGTERAGAALVRVAEELVLRPARSGLAGRRLREDRA